MTRLRIETACGTLGIRAERADGTDEPILFRLFAEVKTHEMAAAPLPREMLEGLLRMQYRSMRNSYAATYETARFEIIELDGEPVGRIVTDVSPERVLFVDIAILPELQGRGLATAVMTALLEEPRRLGVPAEVTVLSTNVASLRLCARVGLTAVRETPPFILLRRT